MTDGSVPFRAGSAADSVSPSLLLRLKADDPAAWERMVRLYGPLIYHWCRRAGLQPADAADVGQEILRTVARKISDFRRDRPGDSFRGWLRIIARRRLQDHRRRLSRSTIGSGGSATQRLLIHVPAPGEQAEDAANEEAEATLVYRRALGLLRQDFEERTWQAFWRVVVDEEDAAGVAAELGMTVNAIYLAKSRILRRLRQEFADVLDE